MGPKKVVDLQGRTNSHHVMRIGDIAQTIAASFLVLLGLVAQIGERFTV